MTVRIGVIGTGAIGRETARLLRAVGLEGLLRCPVAEKPRCRT